MKKIFLLTVLILNTINLNAVSFKELLQNCTNGNKDDCLSLAFKLRSGDGAPQDITSAVKIFNLLCEDRSPKGVLTCATLGDMYYDGNYVIQNYKEAMNYYHKACDGGNVISCANIGGMYYSGQGVKKDMDKAKFFFDKACNAGDNVSCDNLRLLEN